MGEEHPLTLGAVVARAQVVLGGVAVDLVVHVWRDEQLGAGIAGGKERNLT